MSTSNMYATHQTHIGLDLSQIQKDAIKPDVKIIINDLHNPFHQFTIDSHYIVLWSSSLHFRKTLQFPSYCGKNSSATNEIIITLDFSDNTGITEETVHIFFSLFYVPIFSVESLGNERYNFIEENILQLYQLSEQFIFQSLRLHCERQLFGSFSLDHFKLLTEFSLISSNTPTRKHNNAGGMFVIDERIRLYSRYLQWYQCCVEDAKYTQLPKEGRSSNNSRSRRSSGGDNNLCGNVVGNNCIGSVSSSSNSSEEMEVEGPGYIYTEYFSCKKADILREWRSAIENIESCHIPSRSIRTIDDTCTINYYRKLCRRCIKLDANPARDHYIDLGSMTKISSDESDIYSFRLKKLKSETEYTLEIGLDHKNTASISMRNARYMKLQTASYKKSDEDYHNNNEMIVDQPNHNNNNNNNNGINDRMQTSSSSSSGDENTPITDEYIYDCESSITLLSKQLNLPSFSFQYPQKHIGFIGESIGKFKLHDSSDCYIGRCDKCKCEETGVYILILKILLRRLKLFRPCKSTTANT